MNGDKNNVGAKPTWTEPMNDLRLGAARKRLAESQGQEDAIEGFAKSWPTSSGARKSACSGSIVELQLSRFSGPSESNLRTTTAASVG